MPSSTVCLVLCFISWICAQIYNSFRISILVQIQYAEVPTVAAMNSPFSLDTVIGVLIYTVALVLVITCILDNRKCDCQAFLKTVAAADRPRTPHRRRLLLLPLIPLRTPSAAAYGLRIPPMTFSIPRPLWLSRVVIPQRSQLLLLPPPPVDVTLPAHISFPVRRMVFSIPRPFWLWRALYQPQITAFVPTALPSVIELPTALALVTKGAPTRLLFVSLIIGGRRAIQDFKPSFICLYLAPGFPMTCLGLGTTGKSGISICGASVEENVDKKIEDTFVSLPEEEDIHPPDEDPLVSGRQSHAHLLRHVAAAALLRKLQFRVIEEPCYASFEEVVEEEDGIEGAVEDVEKIFEEVAEIEKADGEIQVKIIAKVEGVEEPIEDIEKIVEKGIEDIEQAEIAKDGVEEMDVEVGAVEPAELVALQEIEKAVEEPEHTAEDTAQTLVAGAEPSLTTPEQKVEVEKKTAAATYNETSGLALDEEFDLPSYEEFVKGAPPEPLFAKRNPDIVDYVVVRPPSLDYYVSRAGPKPYTPRVSQLPLLARLSTRISARVAVPVSA
ncbi:hypothetical protein MVEN_01185000 [Mycena venus]|uniref:Uncharacterized protein n=1 Tax=Mycena venus TaxID=2733690 RepID=A0A8H6Y3W8_9AGAR|nr:hypothetical protein MVEN_01185000 [Mycena venus]